MVALRAQCHESMMSPPFGRSAVRTTSHAAFTLGNADQGRNSRCTSKPCSAARSHTSANASTAASRVTGVPQISAMFTERPPIESAMAKNSSSDARMASSTSNGASAGGAEPGSHDVRQSSSAISSPWSSRSARMSASRMPSARARTTSAIHSDTPV